MYKYIQAMSSSSHVRFAHGSHITLHTKHVHVDEIIKFTYNTATRIVQNSNRNFISLSRTKVGILRRNEEEKGE